MKYEKIHLSGAAGSLICLHTWKPDVEAIGALHILHGMAEHAERYGDFAQYMVQKGYAVYAHDHRKHGESLGHGEEVGIFSRQDTFEHMVKDVHMIQTYIRQIQKDVDIVLIGHSMGSMICRRYLQEYGQEVKKAVLIGTMFSEKALCTMGILLGKVIAMLSPSKRNAFLNRLMVGSFNKSFEPGRTAFDWLSRDEKQVDKYIQDPSCGYYYNPQFYNEFLKGILAGHKKSNIIKTTHMPLLFISGSNDPVGFNSAGVKQVIALYKELGYDEITLKLFTGARHELLNEINKGEIYHYIANWIKD